MIDMIQPISFADDPEDRKDGILEVGGEEVSADEADPDYTEYMTGGCNKNQHPNWGGFDQLSAYTMESIIL